MSEPGEENKSNLNFCNEGKYTNELPVNKNLK